MPENKNKNKAKKPQKLSQPDFHTRTETKHASKQKINTNCQQIESEKCEYSELRKEQGEGGTGIRGRRDPIIRKTLEKANLLKHPKSWKASNNPSTNAIPKEPCYINGLKIRPQNIEQKETNNPKITSIRRPNPLNAERGRPTEKVYSCPRLTTPPRCVPKELEQVDRMTSADFRHDYDAHLENMRARQKNMHFLGYVIRQNRHLFKGRVILVICCGPGTLALMAAREGAKIVYAVDYSKASHYAELVVRQNGFDGVIKVLNGRMAAVKLPEKVDGIICNWMGHCLLYESEILEVMEARDRWLKQGGFILPDLGSLFLLGSEERLMKNNHCNWWLSVYGFNMNAMRRYALAEPRYAKTSGTKLLTLAHCILKLDLKTARREDIFVDRKIRLKVNREGYLECFLLYFDVEFSRSHVPMKMSCNPCMSLPYKSLWQQTVLFVDQPFVMRRNLHYVGHLKFAALKPGSFKEMEIRIEFHACQKFDDDLYGGYCSRLVAKRWLMLEHFQTFSEVQSCQDEQVVNGALQDF